MNVEPGAALALISFVASMIIGFGAWMFRIDRGITAVRVVVDDLREHKVANEKEHTEIWNKFNEHGTRIGKHGESLAALRAKLGTRHHEEE